MSCFLKKLSKYDKVQGLTIIVALGFVVANIFAFFAKHHLDAVYPLDFLFDRETVKYTFGDFTQAFLSARNYSPYRLMTVGGVYFPFAYVPFFGLNIFPIPTGLFIYLGGFISTMFVLNRYFFVERSADSTVKKLYFPQFIALIFLSYPVLFCFDRGNIEGLVFIFTCLSMISYQKKYFIWSALWLAAATAMKAYPGVFCLLFLSDKRYKDLVIFILFVVGLSLGSLLLFKDSMSFSISHLAINLQFFKNYFIVTDRALQFNSSLYGFLKLIYLMVQHIPWSADHIASEASLWAYSGLALVLLLALSAYVLWVEKIFWRKLCILVGMILLLPQIAFDYRQLFLYLPIYYFVNDVSDFKRYQDSFFVVLLGLLLIPKNYFFLYGKASVSSSVTVVLLLVLVLTVIISGFKKRALTIV